jgi:kynureninase
MVMLGGINYYTGQLFDMKTITNFAQNLGITVGFDLAHVVGNVPLLLHNWGVDFAVWCTYKYLNAGMGGISGVFVHEKHHGKNLQRLAGWWGYDEESRFEMKPGFKPMTGADGWQISTANILPMACLRASLEIFEEVGMNKIRQKSEQLTGFLIFILEEFSQKNGNIINIITPQNLSERGSQVSMLVEKNGKELFQKLIQKGIIGDWREPNVIRLSPIPLYNSYEEVWRVGEAIGS